MIDRIQSDAVLDKAANIIWQVRDHILLEEPKAADLLVCAVMEIHHARREILRLLPPPKENNHVQV